MQHPRSREVHGMTGHRRSAVFGFCSTALIVVSGSGKMKERGQLPRETRRRQSRRRRVPIAQQFPEKQRARSFTASTPGTKWGRRTTSPWIDTSGAFARARCTAMCVKTLLLSPWRAASCQRRAPYLARRSKQFSPACKVPVGATNLPLAINCPFTWRR